MVIEPGGPGSYLNYNYWTEEGNFVRFSFDSDGKVIIIHYFMPEDHHFNLSDVPVFYAENGMPYSAGKLGRMPPAKILALGITLESVQEAIAWIGLAGVVEALERNGLTLEGIGVGELLLRGT